MLMAEEKIGVIYMAYDEICVIQWFVDEGGMTEPVPIDAPFDKLDAQDILFCTGRFYNEDQAFIEFDQQQNMIAAAFGTSSAMELFSRCKESPDISSKIVAQYRNKTNRLN